jgi:hypothetical protein
MHLFDLTALEFMWARMAKAVLARQAAGTSKPSTNASSHKRAHIRPS